MANTRDRKEKKLVWKAVTESCMPKPTPSIV